VAPPPTFEKDKREAQIWSSFLRRNDTILVKIIALRRDNFNGEIALQVDALPTSVTASESVIPEGQNSSWLSLSTSDKAADWTGEIKIIGKAKVGSSEVTRRAHTATVMWDVPDYNNESVHARLAQQMMLAVSSDPAPFRIELTNAVWQASQAASLSIPMRFVRAPEFKQSVKLRAYIDTQNDPIKEWDADGQAVQTSFELELKQSKLATGSHQLFILAQTRGQIRRIRPDEIPAIESVEKATKDDAEKKRLQERLRLHDVTATFSSPVQKLMINPAATAAK